MTARDDLVDHFADVGEACAGQGVLPDAVEELNKRLLGRIRVVLTGGFECGTPPDLEGRCLACGRRTAEPVADHKSGCPPFDLVMQLVVRTTRWTRATLAYLRSGRA